MLKVFFQELKRFRKLLLATLSILFLCVFLSFVLFETNHAFDFDLIVIKVILYGLPFLIAIRYVFDIIGPIKKLYQLSSFSYSAIIFGKIFLIFSTMIVLMVLSTAIINVKCVMLDYYEASTSFAINKDFAAFVIVGHNISVVIGLFQMAIAILFWSTMVLFLGYEIVGYRNNKVKLILELVFYGIVFIVILVAKLANLVPELSDVSFILSNIVWVQLFFLILMTLKMVWTSRTRYL